MNLKMLHSYSRQLLTVTAFFMILHSAAALGTTYSWTQYKSNFVSADGRVIDHFQSDISHSEGQGYGMLLALEKNDKDVFYRIWKWTKHNLQVRRTDHLLCWSWGKRPCGNWEVIDFNNATDGDILVAWALVKGHEKWKDPAILAEARAIIADMRKKLSFSWQGQNYLLPGYYGFLDKNPAINPSYLILPAFKDFAKVDKPAFWKGIHDSAIYLLSKVRLSNWHLPPDWVEWDNAKKEFRPSRKGPKFSFDAWRIFLYLYWDKNLTMKDSAQALAKHFSRCRTLPRWIDIKARSMSMDECSAGIYALAGQYLKLSGHRKVGEKIMEKARIKMKYEKDDYYSASLFLLSQISFSRSR